MIATEPVGSIDDCPGQDGTSVLLAGVAGWVAL